MGLAVSAILGVFLRYGIDSYFPVSSPLTFPWHTLGINVLGSFMIGVLFVLASEKGLIGENLRLILTTGLLGSFTTFSAFSIQNVLLIQEGRWGLAILYAVASVVAAIAATFCAVTLSRQFF